MGKSKESGTADVAAAREAAPLLGVGVQQLYQMVREGILPPGCYFRIGRRRLRFLRSRLLAFRDAGGYGAPRTRHRESAGAA